MRSASITNTDTSVVTIKDLLITRQSSLKAAVELLLSSKTLENEFTTEQVEAVTTRLTNFIVGDLPQSTAVQKVLESKVYPSL